MTAHRRTFCHDLWLGQETLNWQQLVSADVHLVIGFETACDHALLHLHCEVDLVDRAENLVHFADLRFILQAVIGGGEDPQSAV